ncbi:MAG TPA: bifunctional phosphopantothenoylcysteine decarboxylase/phosphopantothenate--cysteine ligase CoaBC [Methanotrichaceae archaeon]|nr:bifunctional phosphopantothenoylcysteine decarboxylase/phosphopantothenate--cysteine ligase CoaBC [Methanotrichaceae archaeon]
MQSSICGTVSDSLSGKLIVVGITGSIAAVRSVDLIRDLIRRGAKVRCVMSKAACQILHPYALEYASENPVITEITGRVEHVMLCGVEGPADLFLVAPATANTIGKMAQGIDDTPVTTFATTAIGSGKKVMVVPAMHEAMYRHPAVLKNLQILKSMSIKVIDPRIEEGKAKIADSKDVTLAVERLLGRGDLKSKKILVTSGATAERIDPIRILTNRASGKTGTEIALEAYRRGAEVAIVHRARLGLPFKEVYVESAQEMLDAVLSELQSGYDALISTAAIGDYTIAPSSEKIKSGQDLVLKMLPTVKVIRTVRSRYPDLKIVGFKAETFVSDEDLVSRARESMQASGLDLVVANDVGAGGMGSDENRVLIIDRNGEAVQVTGRKSKIAGAVLNALVEKL